MQIVELFQVIRGVIYHAMLALACAAAWLFANSLGPELLYFLLAYLLMEFLFVSMDAAMALAVTENRHLRERLFWVLTFGIVMGAGAIVYMREFAVWWPLGVWLPLVASRLYFSVKGFADAAEKQEFEAGPLLAAVALLAGFWLIDELEPIVYFMRLPAEFNLRQAYFNIVIEAHHLLILGFVYYALTSLLYGLNWLTLGDTDSTDDDDDAENAEEYDDKNHRANSTKL